MVQRQEAGHPNFVNFSKINDPDIDKVLEEGRADTDLEEREKIYQELSTGFAKKTYNIWGWYTIWAFGAAKDVHGLYPPPNPDGEEAVIIASVQPTSGLWISK